MTVTTTDMRATGTICGNCGGTDSPIRTRVVDWGTEYLCDRCIASYKWDDWTLSIGLDGVPTYTHD